MDQEEKNREPDFRIEAELLPVVNYALHQNMIRFLQSVTVINQGQVPLTDGELVFEASPSFCRGARKHLDLLPGGERLCLRETDLALDPEYLGSLTEQVQGELTIRLQKDGQELAVFRGQTAVLTFDQWQGSEVYPELLAAFVTPNHPAVAKILARAAEILGKWTGDPSLDGYQSQDPNRVLNQAGAVYAALQEENLVYAVPPASFGQPGQRVRLCGDVLSQHMGTCLDLSLLYGSCLEAMGLHPILVVQKTHIFPGLWLEERSFPESVQYDGTLVTKRLADGVNEIALVEATAMTAGKNLSFDKAGQAAEAELADLQKLECILDVHRARLSGVLPLPSRIRMDTGWKIQMDLPEQKISAAPRAVPGALPVEPGDAAPMSKKTQWERKLLDLGLRNALINMRLTRTVLPILASSLDELEDALADGGDFSILPRPEDWHRSSDSFTMENLHELEGLTQVIAAEFKNKRLRTCLTEAECAKTVKELYRASKTNLEENGANTLYLAMGLLKWYETPRSQKPRFAPIVLLPVEMVRKSAAQGYVIRLRDEEPQMNVTLLEKLKQDFGIQVGGLDPLPQDEHGIDMRKVFTILRKAVMGESRWDVLESGYLGIFSFSQFVMWNDIRNRSQDLEQNKIVRSLMEGKLTWPAEEMTIGDRVPEDEALLPIPADASQLYAIEEASKGRSFVLHGPPGTGKSQTITALIANALAQGKSVLFVAEKMAALEVVQRRLEGIGIGPFCLELHSNKSKKKDLLEQLRQAAEVTKAKTPEAYAAEAERIAGLRRDLDGYAQALHRELPCGMTLFDLVNRYEEYRQAPDIGALPERFGRITARELGNLRDAVSRLTAAGREAGHPKEHPLARIRCRQYSQRLRQQIPEALTAYEAALSRMDTAAKGGAETLAMAEPETQEELERLVGIAGGLGAFLSAPRAWARSRSLDRNMERVEELCARALAARKGEETLLGRWKESFLAQDGPALLTQWNEAEGKWALAKALGKKKLANSLAIHAKGPVEKDILGRDLADLAQYQAERAAAEKLLAELGDELDGLYCGKDTDWARMASLAEKARAGGRRLQELDAEETRRSVGGDRSLEPIFIELDGAWKELEQSRGTLYDLMDMAPNPESCWLAGERRLCEALRRELGGLKEWITWNAAAQEVRDLGLEPLVRAYEGGLPHDEVLPAFEKAVSGALAMEAIDNAPELGGFSGAVFNEKIRQFQETDRRLTELTRREIYCRLAARVPNFTKEGAQSSELGILQRAIRSGGRGVSIRRLFEQLPELLPRLCPCMLMSPISAAQYLDPKRKPFDLVVFDEASQLPTSKAVGALARGENAVIVGDPKQMPPTSFFATNGVDEDNLDLEDLESILDDCLALNMPEAHLLWHYRSRHESLIAFSNTGFYEGKLYTFPSVNDRASKVNLIHVDGVFSRGKTRQNRAEADAVVEELKRRCHDPKDRGRSVGVVTFNISQQNLIDDLLNEACLTDPELEQWAYHAPEPVFIKNLENVQGDERDVILFSVGYGPDETGKVYMNFGPLNRDGGWRRLNVAVSRARYEMVVFSTLTPDQIDLSKTGARGVAELRRFLEYASGKPLGQSEESLRQAEGRREGIAEAICRELEAAGYQTDRWVGHSAYRIDVGVVDPENPEEYLLGILLDGDSYGAAKTTRDRELAQISVLEGLDWNILRVWTMDWWDNREKELDRVKKAIAEAGDRKAQPETPEVPSAPERLPEEKTPLAANLRPEEPAGEAPVYRAAALPTVTASTEELIRGAYDEKLRWTVQKILDREAPITEGLLLRRLAQCFGIGRVGTRIQEKFARILAGMDLTQTEQEGTRVYWNRDQVPSDYDGFRASGSGENKREAKDVPLEEGVNALCRVLSEQISLSEEDLIRESAKLMGYARLGAQVEAMLCAALNRALAQGRVTRGQGGKWILC